MIISQINLMEKYSFRFFFKQREMKMRLFSSLNCLKRTTTMRDTNRILNNDDE